ncbi:MAG: SSU ribosomal protein S15p (S13e), partial [uncultured Thermomicrobiales bacterium]
GVAEGPEGRHHLGLPDPRVRYRLAGSPDRAPDRAHQRSDGPPSPAPAGPSLPPGPVEAGGSSTSAPRLPQRQGHRALPGDDPTSRSPTV